MLDLRDTPGYQYLVNEATVEYMHSFILKIGRENLGEPTAAQVARLENIKDIERLERIAVKVMVVKKWDTALRVT